MKIFITIIFALLMSTVVQANISDPVTNCPSIELIHQLTPLIKNAEISEVGDHMYDVIISGVKMNEINWEITYAQVTAKNKNEAASIAAKRNSAVSDMVYPNARMGWYLNGYACLYYDKTSSRPYVFVYASNEEKN